MCNSFRLQRELRQSVCVQMCASAYVCVHWWTGSDRTTALLTKKVTFGGRWPSGKCVQTLARNLDRDAEVNINICLTTSMWGKYLISPFFLLFFLTHLTWKCYDSCYRFKLALPHPSCFYVTVNNHVLNIVNLFWHLGVPLCLLCMHALRTFSHFPLIPLWTICQSLCV